MAIIDGNKIGAADISGRDIGLLLKEKTFLYTYPDGISRLSYDAWQLCHSPLIDKWAKFSPLTANGGKWVSPSAANDPHAAVGDYQYTLPNPNYDANISQFANYNHSSKENLVVRCEFPENLWSDAINPLPRGNYIRWTNDNFMGLEEVFKEQIVNGKIALYPCVAIGSDWCTTDNYTSPILFATAPPMVLNGTVKMTYCLCDVEKKHWGDPFPPSANFYSLKAKPDTITSMMIPVKTQAINYNVDILSSAYGSGTFATIKRRSDQVRGIYILITRQDGLPLPSNNNWSIRIYETMGNQPTGAFLETPLTLANTFMSKEDTFESQVSGVQKLMYELKHEGKVVATGAFPQVK